MRKAFAVTIAVIFLSYFTKINAQQVTTEWAIHNFNGYPVGVMIGLDNEDNVFVAGHAGDHTKIITTKYNTYGNLIWENLIPSDYFDNVAYDVVCDSNGDVYVAHNKELLGLDYL